jgi:flagellar biosynthesis protein FlhF
MLVKRYVVNEMPEAVAMIREELGKDAVILSTKKIQKRGFLGLFSKTQIEVVAAANEEEKRPERPVAPLTSRNTALGAYQQASKPLQPSVPLQAEPPRPAMAEPVQTTGRPIQEASVATLSPPQVTEPAVTARPATTAPPLVLEEGKLLTEVQEMRNLLRTLIHSPDSQVLPESIVNIRKQLLDQDVKEHYVDELIERGIRHFNQVKQIDEQEFRGILTKFIKEDLETVDKPSPLSPNTRVASFLGPTGVGKTTTIAKLAAEQVLMRGKKVGLITTDTYRIAAVEQLRTYANILNVPLEVCYSPEDILRALEKFADRDVILADTAGRNYRNTLNVRELDTYLQALRPDEAFLVLSLTTKASDLEEIVGNFGQVRIDKFLFTKADETKTYGSVYNLVKDYRIPLSYLTTGQNVPDDIETLSTEKLASLIAGEKSDV